MSKLSYTYMYTHTHAPLPLFPILPFTNLFPSSSSLPPILSSPLPYPTLPFSPCAVLENMWVYIALTAILTNLIWWHLVAAMDLWGSGTCDRRDTTYRSSKLTTALVLE